MHDIVWTGLLERVDRLQLRRLEDVTAVRAAPSARKAGTGRQPVVQVQVSRHRGTPADG